MQSIIIDTNIGYDIADTWALSLMLSTNLFDVKLISVTNGDTDYQVSLVAKMLKLLNKEHIPIARGVNQKGVFATHPQKSWLNDFALNEYRGHIYDSYGEAYDEILSSNSDAIVVGLAPYTALLTVLPTLRKNNTKLVTMCGAVNTKDINCELPLYLEAAKKLFMSDLNITLLPITVCNKMQITGENYRKIRTALTTVAKIICENETLWQEVNEDFGKKNDYKASSAIIRDLAPVLYLLFPQNFEVMEKHVYLADDGVLCFGGVHKFNLVFKVQKLNAMLNFASEQYCTNFSCSKDIKQLEIEGMYSLTYLLKKANVLLSVVEYGWEVHGPSSSYGPAERDYYILHFITKGKGRYVVAGKEYSLKKGDCFLIPSKLTTYYEADPQNPYTYYWVGFEGIEAKELLEKSGFIVDDNYVIHPKNYNAVFEIFSNFEVTTTNNSAIPYQLIAKLYMLFSEIMSEQSDEYPEVSNYVDLAINYMNMNYSKKLSIDLLSKIVGLERTYFYRLFKNATKISPKDYLSNLRIEKAKILLCNSNMNIKEIALSVGFSNYFTFEKLFKEKTGINPTNYRQKSH